MSIVTRISLCAAALAIVACVDEPASSVVTHDQALLDRITPPDQPASLVVLSPTATVGDREKLEATIAQLGGAVIAALPPRLVIAQLPAGVDPVLTQLGAVARFDRAVVPADVVSPTWAEERFLAVHAARWYPTEVPPAARLAPTFRPRPAGEAEGAPPPLPAGARIAAEGTIDPEDQIAVPYASGTVVVSVVLPESNGAVDPSTEDWSETQVRETYVKIQAALDRIAAADPNADLRFVMHFESAPAAGGLAGTVDTVYEFGQRAQWGANNTEYLATADVLGKILGRTLTEFEVWNAALEYTAGLKSRYRADAAFFVIVAANGNFTAGLRAHAFINGPWTVLDTGYSYETFAHEFGHIFGALDEYCPDACVPPTAIQGYLGIYNANAQAQAGSSGIDNGRGEASPSLMIYNQPGAINGYTRGAFGWLDVDGDAVIDVRDTLPRSELSAVVTGQRVRVQGQIVDRGATRQGGPAYSANRITALEYAFAASGPWFSLPLPADQRGRQRVDVELGPLPAGSRTVWLRGVNSVGNREPAPLALAVTTTGTTNTAPHVRVDVPARAGTAAPITLTTATRDLENDTVTVRYDLDGNGSWDTTYRAPGAYSFTAAAGARTLRVQARDQRGATRIITASVPVVAGATAPTVTLSPVPSLVHGANPALVTATATASGGAAVRATAELATDDEVIAVTPTLGADGQLAVRLPTPKALAARGLDLSGGNPALAWLNLRDVVALGGELVAVAAGTRGVWVVDLANRDAPAIVAEVALETTAHRLLRVGTRLYVLGTYLTVLDVTNPRAPVELKQLISTTDTASSDNAETMGTGDGEGGRAVHFHSASHGGRVTRTIVRVTIDHPRPSDLLIKLVPDKALNLSDIVLWDHRAAAGGLRTFTFSSTNLLALRALDGTFADGFWQLEVVDEVGNGDTGNLVSSQLEFVTRSKAARVLPGASELAGVTSWGDLVVAGAGLEVLDVAVPRWITSLSRVTGIATNTATMVGDVAVVSAALDGKNPDGTPATGRLRGLCAVDVSLALLPRVVRCDTALGGAPGDFAHVGNRLYLTVGDRCAKGEECPPPMTVIGDATRFARNWTWRLGTTPLRVDRWAVAWNGSLWTLGETGAIDQLNVANPAAVTLVERFPRTFTGRLVPLTLPEVMLFDFAPSARVATLGQAVSYVSRVYRLTVTASDAAGNTTRATRHVHVIPYNHGTNPPTLSVLPPRWGSDLSEVAITTTDADATAAWDPFRFARVDFDGDGAFDTDWLWMGNDGTGTFQTSAPAPAAAGARTAVVEVRDGFWATARATVVIPAP